MLQNLHFPTSIRTKKVSAFLWIINFRPPHDHIRNSSSLPQFYRNFHGKCSNERHSLKMYVPLKPLLLKNHGFVEPTPKMFPRSLQSWRSSLGSTVIVFTYLQKTVPLYKSLPRVSSMRIIVKKIRRSTFELLVDGTSKKHRLSHSFPTYIKS